MDTNANNFYTVEEVASLLKVHPNTVRGWIRQGKLNAIKINTLTRIREADLEIFMKPFKGKSGNKTQDTARYKD
ncbi:MAG: helix-turn-helix domain-containing protein [Thermodesulfobacteriota bacterium]